MQTHSIYFPNSNKKYLYLLYSFSSRFDPTGLSHSPAQNTASLADSFACSVFPAPRAFPTLTLPATLNPKANWRQASPITALRLLLLYRKCLTVTVITTHVKMYLPSMQWMTVLRWSIVRPTPLHWSALWQNSDVPITNNNNNAPSPSSFTPPHDLKRVTIWHDAPVPYLLESLRSRRSTTPHTAWALLGMASLMKAPHSWRQSLDQPTGKQRGQRWPCHCGLHHHTPKPCCVNISHIRAAVWSWTGILLNP